ncbi:TPA: GGDEF domain-containing protein [Vibrio diabolicus]|uniref:Two-component response regulator and GGDEF family protein YeaJ n=2 Tax=Vibrio antiquarius (strain Ex25) TaxID=150340 RepID=A0ACA6QQZ7_VIBAE|nr:MULTISPECIES: GGDEF domain-containing protein [Vibrio]ACY52972.1 putative two-component response regulator and GGDEF family protein YeaJ [Vibrio antiquarius]EDN57158.1 fog: ggdef domain containing protein [Vibrio antiquarius]MCG6240328.1 GGDEF domain-containing protein [Vibrio diabolicus]MCJ0882872.1 GGDEF domain-containing protein [Vibrio sp. CCB-PB317]MCR9965663.1 GGDEF domain-containing protein [Vibrio antiquarius]
MNVRSFVSSFAVAMLLFIVSVTMIGAVLISYEEKQFNTYANNLAKTKQKVILLGLLTEAQLAQYENFSIEQIEVLTDFSFQDAIYALKPYKNLDYVETVARKALHQAEAHLSNVYDREDAILYFRSYTSDKLILERPIPALEGSKETFDIEWCRVNYACILAAWKEQLSDRVLISKPFKTTYSDEMALSIMSPVYYRGKLVGEFSEQLYLSSLYNEGKAVDVEVSNGNKQIIIYFPSYPLAHFAYTQSYVADNNNLVIYQYPFSKIVVDYSFILVIYSVVAFAYYRKANESKQSKIQLENALSDVTQDDLTGLLNRRVFKEERFKHRMEVEPYSIIAIDGNRIKKINDRYGHHVGDEVIVIIADSMRKVFRNSDYLVRTGGDEFIVILPGCSMSKASMLAKKLRGVVKHNRLNTLDIEISVSTGVAVREEDETLQEVIVRADEELYEMKKQRV